MTTQPDLTPLYDALPENEPGALPSRAAHSH